VLLGQNRASFATGPAPIATQMLVRLRRLSSNATFYCKWIFPTIWFGSLFLTVAVPLFGGSKSGPPLPFPIVPVFMLIIGFFFMKKLVFDLVDEVWDGGDVLVIRNGHLEERVALSDIMNVSYSQFTSPPRVTLSLRHPSVFGTRVTFCAPLRFTRDAIIDELIQRIDAQRRV
jgi:hypothetical protein